MNSNLWQNIKIWRKKNGLTQQQFADDFSQLYRQVHQDNYKIKNVEYSLKTISTWENGVVPSFDCIMVLAQMFNMRIDELLYDDVNNFAGYNMISTDKINIINSMVPEDKALLLYILDCLSNANAREGDVVCKGHRLSTQVFLPLIYNQDEIIVSDKMIGLEDLTTQYFDKRQSQFIELGLNNYIDYISKNTVKTYADSSRLLHRFISWDFITSDYDGQDIDFTQPYTLYDALTDQQSPAIDDRRVTRYNSCLYDACAKDFEEMVGIFDSHIDFTDNEMLKKKTDAISETQAIINSKFGNLVEKGIVNIADIGFYEIGVFNSGFAKWLKDFENYIMLTVNINLTADEVATLLAEYIKNKILSCQIKQ